MSQIPQVSQRPAGTATRSIAAILADFDQITSWLNGKNIEEDNIDESLLAKLGVNSLDVRRGKCIIPGQENYASASYGLMPTPDQVLDVVLPTDGLLMINYKAIWRESVNNAARAAIFLNGNQLKNPNPTAPAVQECGINAGPNIYNALYSSSIGLSSSANATAHSSDVTTGETISPTTGGATCMVFAAAGTYDVSVQFKASSGNLDVTERKLWVKAVDYS